MILGVEEVESSHKVGTKSELELSSNGMTDYFMLSWVDIILKEWGSARCGTRSIFADCTRITVEKVF